MFQKFRLRKPGWSPRANSNHLGKPPWRSPSAGFQHLMCSWGIFPLEPPPLPRILKFSVAEKVAFGKNEYWKTWPVNWPSYMFIWTGTQKSGEIQESESWVWDWSHLTTLLTGNYWMLLLYLTLKCRLQSLSLSRCQWITEKVIRPFMLLVFCHGV